MGRPASIAVHRMAALSTQLRAFLGESDDRRAIGPFHLLRQLGRGGFAPVWLAREVYGGVEVRSAAVKLFSLGSQRSGDGETLRVIEEARALCRVEHPHVVRFFSLAVDEARGVAGLAMEYVAGESLDSALRRRGPLPIAEVVDLGIALASALSAVHREALIHRDVKPANVVDAGGIYKLIDFGIADSVAPKPPRLPKKVVVDDVPIVIDDGDDTHLLVSPASGTIGYLDPECLLSGAPASSASDLYALGVTLFECLTGKLPSAATGEHSGLRTDILDGSTPPPSLDALSSAVPPALSRLVGRLLAPTRALRVRSAEAVANELLALKETLSGKDRVLPPEEIGPFRGLGRFEEEDANVYFGRSGDVATALSMLHAQGLVALLGPSGSGKSSLARAGIVPAVRERGIGRAPASWRVITVSPGIDPRRTLGDALSDLVPGARTRDPGDVAGALAAWAETSQEGVLVVVDQLEELSTVSETHSARWAAELLAHLGERPMFGVRVLVAARRDLLDSLLALPLLGKPLARGALFVAPLTDAVWADVLDQALAAYGYQFETDDLRAEVLDELRGSVDAMPLVQFALTELWRQREPEKRRIPRSGLLAIGGIAGALQAHADATLLDLDRNVAGGETAARAILLELTTVEGTRATRSEEELSAAAGEDARAVLAALESARLVVRDVGGYTLAHETLLTSWTTLREWVEESRDDRALAAELARAAREWRASGDATLLWRKRRLEAAEEAAPRGMTVGAESAEFLRASRRSEQRGRRLAMGAALLLSVIATGGLAAYIRGVAREQASTRAALGLAKESARLEIEARASDHQTSLRLILSNARAALESDPSLAIARLKDLPIHDSDWPAARFVAAAARINGIAAEVIPLASRPMQVAASDAGTRIVTSSFDSGVQVGDTATWSFSPRVTNDRHFSAGFVTISRDGETVAAARDPGQDGEVVAWTPKGTVTFPSRIGVTRPLVLTADGAHIVTIRTGGTSVLDVATGGARRLSDSRGSVVSTTTSPDGASYVELQGDTAVIWSVVSGARRTVALPKGSTQIAIASDGTLAVASKDGVRITRDGRNVPISMTDAQTLFFSRGGTLAIVGRRRLELWDPSGGVRELAEYAPLAAGGVFTRDGRRVVAHAEDGSLLVWSIGSGGTPRVLRGAPGSTDVAELDHGRLLAPDERGLRAWADEPSPFRRAVELSRGAWGVQLASDDNIAVGRGFRGDLQRCDLASGACQEIVPPGAPLQHFHPHRVSADGRTCMWLDPGMGIRSASGPGASELLTSTSRAQRFDASDSLSTVGYVTDEHDAFVLESGSDTPRSIAASFAVDRMWISPRGSRAGVSGADESAIFDVASGALRPVPIKNVEEVRFDIDERRVLLVANAGSSRVRAAVWNSDDPIPRTLDATGRILGASFHGAALVALDRGTTLDLLDAETGRVRSFPKRSGDANWGRFSPDQRTFVFATYQGAFVCDVASWGCREVPKVPVEDDVLGKDAIAFARDGRMVLWRRHGIDVVQDDLPWEPESIAAWLSTATTMYVDDIDPPPSCATESTRAVDLTFVNGVDRSVCVFRVDERCNEVLHQVLPPGGVFSGRSFVGHPWRVRDQRTREVLLDFEGARNEKPVERTVRDGDAGYGYEFSPDPVVGGDPPASPIAQFANGRLEPEVIQSVVRRAFPAFQKCAQDGGSRGSLEGRLTMRFVIGRDGRVANVANGGSDLPDQAVIECVKRSFSSLNFPEGGRGIITVVYPLLFSP